MKPAAIEFDLIIQEKIYAKRQSQGHGKLQNLQLEACSL
jgi:hypothetical protein